MTKRNLIVLSGFMLVSLLHSWDGPDRPALQQGDGLSAAPGEALEKGCGNRPDEYVPNAGQDAPGKYDYKFQILNQHQVYEIDPQKKIFRSEQTYTLRNTNLVRTRKMTFAAHPQFQLLTIILKDADGRVLPCQEPKSIGTDLRLGAAFAVYEMETESEIAPGQVLSFYIRYALNPEAITEWPKYWWNLTVSQNASFGITPANGNNIVFGLNYSSPFVIELRYPEGNLGCAPGNRISARKKGGYLVEIYESKKPNIPVFSCAPYKKIERRGPKLSAEFFLYPHETMSPDAAEFLFSAVALYLRSFGDNGSRDFRVATAGPYQATAKGAENKGNCIFMMDTWLRNAAASPEARWVYVSKLFHEIFHDWNLFSLDWEGDYGEWFGEGGATFIEAWTAEKILGPDAGRHVRRTILSDFISQKGFQAEIALNQAQKTTVAQRALIYKYGALVWEQLRQKLGDTVFFAGFGDFFKKNLFQKAGLDDLLRCWEPYTKIHIRETLGPWIDHNAQISLILDGVETRSKNGKFETAVTMTVDADRDYEILTALEYRTEKNGPGLFVPLSLIKKGSQTVAFMSDQEPVFVKLDPDYRVPRKTDDRLTWTKGT